jgi:16S rRNA (adenine1518-N6/adenine1519-N6)-dimethyltransferase
MSVSEKIHQRMQQLGIQPKKSLGQNFLISHHVIDRIVDAAKEFHPKALLEIGPGLGSLTDPLKDLGISYKLLELDHVFCDYWKGQGLDVWEGDALHFPWDQQPQMSGTLLVSNLPYQISSSIVIDRSMDADPCCGMILMFQKEVAQRIRAKSGNDDYGMLSVVAQSFWKIRKLIDAGPREFFPPPKIASQVLVFEPLPWSLGSKEKFLKLVKASFLHRRKLVCRNWEEALSLPVDDGKEFLRSRQLSETARAEEMSLEDFHAMSVWMETRV